MNPPLAWDAVMLPASVYHSAPSTAGSSGGTRTGADAAPSARPPTGALQGAGVASAMTAAGSRAALDSGAQDPGARGSGARDSGVAWGVAVGLGASRGSRGGDGDRDGDGDGDGGGGRFTRGRDRREHSAEASRGSSILRPRLGVAAAGDEEDEEMMTDEACFEVGERGLGGGRGREGARGGRGFSRFAFPALLSSCPLDRCSH